MERLRERLCGFHRNDQGQILPLVLAFAIAFFTGTVLVINTGRAVNDRVQAQNAVDAAIVSGTTTVARGMNYIARNNVQIAKTLATIVIVRSIPPSIDAALITLDVWETVVIPAMKSAASALMGGVYTYPVGVALQIAAVALEIKVKIEKVLLKAIEKVADKLKDWWDKDGKGIGWKLAKGLSTFGTVLVYVTPVLAQAVTSKVVYKYNAPLRDEDRGFANKRDDLPWMQLIPWFGNPQAWMLPLFPNIPACRGKFGHFAKPTTHYTQMYAKPILIVGWVAFTLSLFPVYFEVMMRLELKYMFEGGSAPGTPPVDKKRTDEIQKLTDENKDLEKEVNRLDDDIARLDNEIDDLLIELEGYDARDDLQSKINDLERERADKVAEKNQAIRDRDAVDKTQNPEEYNKFQEQVDKLTAVVAKLDDRIATKKTKKDNLTTADKGLKKLKQEALAERNKHSPGSDEWNAENQKVTNYERRINEIEGFGIIQKGEIPHKQDLIKLKERLRDGKQDQIKKNNDRIQELTSPPEGGGGDVDLGGTIDESKVKEKKGYFPYLIDGGKDPEKDWKALATYYAFAWFNVRDPLLSGEFELFGRGRVQTLYGSKMDLGIVYAAARLYNPTRADLWYPDWRAKLVRVQPSLLLSRNPLGSFPKECGSNKPVKDETNTSNNNSEDEKKKAKDWKGILDTIVGKLSMH